MSEQPTRRRGPYAKSAARRQHIVEQAYAVFATHGYHGSSLREIAAAAEISLSTLQHHFASKEELLVAVLARRDQLGAGAHPPAGEDFADHLVAEALSNERVPGLIALFSVLSAEAFPEDHPGHAYFLDRYESLRAQYTAEFEALRAGGRLAPGVEPALAAATVVALWEGIQLQWLYQPDRIHAADALRGYLRLVIREEAAPSGTAS